MIDTERSIDDLSRLHAEIMMERAAGLHESAQHVHSILVEREEAIARLRTQVASLRTSLSRGRPAAAHAEVARPAQAPPTRPALVARPLPARIETPVAARANRWRTAVPYAAILACAAVLELSGVRRPAPVGAGPVNLFRPAPAVLTNGLAAAKGEPVLSDDDRSQEALLLVHEWKLPGDDVALSERLGGTLDIPGARPAWSVERTGTRGYRVTYQDNANSLPYSFDADLDGRAVWPTAETQELLAPRLASLRDSAR